MSTFKIEVRKTTSSRIKDVDWNNLPFGRIFSDHSFIAEFKNGKWDHMRIEPYGLLGVSPASPVLNYGLTIFEGTKAMRNKDNEILLFRPQDNVKRLNISAERVCLPSVPEELFMEGLRGLIHIDREWAPTAEGASFYIRPILFAADACIEVRKPEEFMFVIITGPAGKYYSKPLNVKIETTYTRAARGGIGYSKTGGNYAASFYPTAQANKDGYDQLLWTDGVHHRYIEESGMMNVMFVIDGTLVTPELTDSILAGINRESVLTLARDWGMKTEERPVEVEEAVEALKNGKMTEAFGVGTAASIAPIATISYKDLKHPLPEISTWKTAPKLTETLNGIKRGTIEDKFNWIVKA